MADHKHIVFSLVGPDRTGLVDRLTEVVVRHCGNIEDSRMAVLGGEFAVIMLVAVAADKREAMEQDMARAAAELNLLALSKLTQGRRPQDSRISFVISVSGMDHEGIVNPVVHCLAGQGVSITNLESRVTMAPHTATELFSMSLQVEAPSAISLSELRHRLQEVADRLNVDIDVEAENATAVRQGKA